MREQVAQRDVAFGGTQAWRPGGIEALQNLCRADIRNSSRRRRIKVELVNPENNEPLRIVDEKGKSMKYQIIAKAGYQAPREVE